GSHDRVLGRRILRRAGAEYSDGARGEYGAPLLARDLQHRLEAGHVDVPREPWVPLADRGQDSREVEHRIRLVTHDDLPDGPRLRRVQNLERSRLRDLHVELAHIGGEDVRGAIELPQPGDEPGADLAAGSGHENTLQGLLRDGTGRHPE